MVTAANLANVDPKEADLEWNGDKVHLVYNPAAITGDMIEQALEGARNATAPGEADAVGFLAMCDQLPVVLKKWDLREREPRPGEQAKKVPFYPITRASLLKLPIGFVSAVWAKLTEGERPPEGGSFDGG